VHGTDHPDVGRTLTNLGIVQRQVADLSAARASLARALAVLGAVYEPDHPDVARTVGNLGNIQQQLGDLPTARASLEHALAIFEGVYGPDHPEIAITLTNLGNASRSSGTCRPLGPAWNTTWRSCRRCTGRSMRKRRAPARARVRVVLALSISSGTTRKCRSARYRTGRPRGVRDGDSRPKVRDDAAQNLAASPIADSGGGAVGSPATRSAVMGGDRR
jgi:hypothetical protein